VDITWFGHSCFRIKGNSAVVITDPLPPDLGYRPDRQTANIVTISHFHPGHAYLDMIEGNPRIIKSPGEYEISDVLIIGIAAYHDAVKGQARGKTTVYVMDIDGVTVCHTGDLGHVLNDEQIEELGNIDVLMLPVGGVSTINASMAAEMVRKIEPKIVIPMHYRTEKSTRELDGVDLFLKELGRSEVEPRPKVSINRNSLPAGMQIYLMNPSA